jgi:hypothetical protein
MPDALLAHALLSFPAPSPTYSTIPSPARPPPGGHDDVANAIAGALVAGRGVATAPMATDLAEHAYRPISIADGLRTGGFGYRSTD